MDRDIFVIVGVFLLILGLFFFIGWYIGTSYNVAKINQEAQEYVNANCKVRSLNVEDFLPEINVSIPIHS